MKDLQTVLRENKERIQRERMAEIEKNKREHEKEVILTVIVAAFIVFVTFIAVKMYSEYNYTKMGKCVAEHEKTWCEEMLK